MEELLKNLLKKVKLSESTISTILGGIVVFVVGLLIFNYFKAEQTEKPFQEITVEETILEGTQSAQLIPENLPETYTVKKGDHLWKISEKFYQTGHNWVDIVKENNLVNPDSLAAGIELKLPKVAVRQQKEEKGAVVEVIEVETLSAEPEKTISEDKYIVEKGDHLWKIAVRAYGDGYKWPEIAKVNNLTYPDCLAVGQELKLPR